MSTLCAFFGIDSKAQGKSTHASAYLASESFLTYQDGSIKDTESQKVFACRKAAAIFGYVGDERVGEFLKETVQQIDDNGLFAASSESAERSRSLLGLLDASLPEGMELIGGGATVIYIGRTDGANPSESRFHIWESIRPARGSWAKRELKVPKKSGPPVSPGFWGTGSHLLTKITGKHLGHYDLYSEFTWAYFRTLWEALRQNHDDRSGGTVQLVFLPRGGDSSYIGIVDDNNNRFVCGKPFSEDSPPVSRWVDVDFDERDPKTLEKRLDRKRAPVVKRS